MGQREKLPPLAILPSRAPMLERKCPDSRARLGQRGQGPLKRPPGLGCVQLHVGAPPTSPSSSDVPEGRLGLTITGVYIGRL